MRPKHLAITTAALAAALIVAPATAANAEPYDGTDIEFGLGVWDLSTDPLALDDVYLVFPDGTSQYTDLWDGMGYTSITATAASIAATEVSCADDSLIDVSVEAETGDLVITCLATNSAFAAAELEVRVEIRIYSSSDLVRISHSLTNNSDAEIAIDSVEYATNFGETDSIWNYQNQSDAILAVPAETVSDDRANELVAANARWIVNFKSEDAPGGLAWGHADAPTDSFATTVSDDDYISAIDGFTIPVGEVRHTAFFANWTPALLIASGYTNTEGRGQVEAANALVPLMAEFNSFSGRLTTGFAIGDQVVNWGTLAAAAPAPAPALPATGAGEQQLIATGGIAIALLLLGGLSVWMLGRQRSESA